jgi:hypothetical protein
MGYKDDHLRLNIHFYIHKINVLLVILPNHVESA